MADSPTIPDGVVDQETADEFLDQLTTSVDGDLEEVTEAPSTEDTAEASDEQSRDELGRFSSDEPPVEPAQAPPVDAPGDDGPAPEPTAVADAEESVGLTDEEWDALPPLQYRADGKAWEIPGSKVHSDGVHIPSEHMPEVLRLIQSGQAHQGSFREELATRKSTEDKLIVERDSAQAALNQISTKLEELITVDGAFETWIEDQRGNWEGLKTKAALAAQKVELDTMRDTTTREAAERAEAEMVPLMHNQLAAYVSHFAAQSGFDQTTAAGKATLRSIYDRLVQPQYLDQIFPKREGGGRNENPDFVATEMLFLAGVRDPASRSTARP